MPTRFKPKLSTVFLPKQTLPASNTSRKTTSTSDASHTVDHTKAIARPGPQPTRPPAFILEQQKREAVEREIATKISERAEAQLLAQGIRIRDFAFEQHLADEVPEVQDSNTWSLAKYEQAAWQS